MVVFGPNDTVAALELGAVSKLVIFEELETRRVVVEHSVTKEKKILYLQPDQLEEHKYFLDDRGIDLTPLDKETTLIEWLIDNFKNWGA